MKKSDVLIEFLEKIEKKYGYSYKLHIIKQILAEKEVEILPDELKKVNSHKLSLILYSICLNDLKNNNLDSKIFPLMIKKSIKEKYNFKKTKKGVAILLAGSMILSSAAILSSKKEETSLDTNVVQEDVIDKKASEDEEVNDKQEILDNFKEYTTVDEILKREEELKSLCLTDDDKIYKDCKLSPEVQRFIYEQSIVYDFPVDLTFAIIDTETQGEFNSSGVKSIEYAEGYFDIGLTQQNSIYSVKNQFCKKFDISYDKALNLVQYDDFVNIVACFIKYNEIRDKMCKDYGINNVESYYSEFAGRYNGWDNWRNYNISVTYVNNFNNVYKLKYTNHHTLD